ASPPVDAQRSVALPAAGGVRAAARQGGERRDGAGGGEQGQGAAARDHRRSFGSVDRGPEGPAAGCCAGRGGRGGRGAGARRGGGHGLFLRPGRGAPLLSRSSVSRALTLSPVRAAAQEARRAAILQVLARRGGMRAESARPTAPRAAS